jgi:hypothetical protein
LLRRACHFFGDVIHCVGGFGARDGHSHSAGRA